MTNNQRQMTTITLEPTLQTKLEQFAQSINQSVEEMINQALRQYLDELSRRKLEAEIQVYEKKLHVRLKKSHLGQFVAIHQGKLVDADTDCGKLFLRIEARYGDLAILIRQVQATPHEIYQFHGIRMGQNQ